MNADNIIQIAENSPEKVAFDLLKIIATFEGKGFHDANRPSKPDRKYILDTYAEILQTVRSPHLRSS